MQRAELGGLAGRRVVVRCGRCVGFGFSVVFLGFFVELGDLVVLLANVGFGLLVACVAAEEEDVSKGLLVLELGVCTRTEHCADAGQSQPLTSLFQCKPPGQNC